MIFRGFFRCSCGKMHTYGSIGYSSKCVCGIKLWDFVFNSNRPAGHKKTFG